MTINSSRRSLLAGLSVAPVALAPVLPAIAAPHPDAELFTMIERWEALGQRLQAATSIMWDAEERCRDVAVPEAMFERDGDMDLFDCSYARRYDAERRWYSPDDRGHRYLKSIVGLMERHGCHGKNATERMERAREIICAIDAYLAERAAAERECGLDIAEAEEERLSVECREQTVQIVMAPARTTDGVLRKTALIADIHPGGKDFMSLDQRLSQLLWGGAPLDELVAFGLARDLLELANKGGANV